MTFAEHRKGVNRVVWGRQASKHLLASASMDHTVRLWDVFRSQECKRVLEHHTQAVKAVQWTLDGYVQSCTESPSRPD